MIRLELPIDPNRMHHFTWSEGPKLYASREADRYIQYHVGNSFEQTLLLFGRLSDWEFFKEALEKTIEEARTTDIAKEMSYER